MGRKAIKMVPNSLFYVLWMDESCTTLALFIDKYTSPFSKDRILFQKKYNLDPNETVVLLKNIYVLKTKAFRDLLTEVNLRKADASRIFCIPIRTIEDWYAEKNRCPLYVKLMIAKEFRILNLGKYVYLESEIEYRKRKPQIYQIRNRKEPKLVSSSLPGGSKSDTNKSTAHKLLYDSYDHKKEYLPYEDYLRRKSKEQQNNKDK